MTNQQCKWTCFTYIVKETRFTTKLFLVYSVKTSFHTTNTLEKHVLTVMIKVVYTNLNVVSVQDVTLDKQDVQSRSDVMILYRLFVKNAQLSYSQHILNTGHLCGILENILEILNIQHKVPYLNMSESTTFIKPPQKSKPVV
jgi:hypothetical protein